MKTKTKKPQIENYKVIPINIELIESELHERLGTTPETTRYRVEKVAWLKDTDCITDTECVYFNMHKELQGSEKVYVCDIDVREDTKMINVGEDAKLQERGWRCGMFPAFTLHFTFGELLEKYSSKEEIDLKSFMGSRYNYNDRIAKNTDNLMDNYSF